MSVFGLSPPLKCEGKDGKESQEVDVSSEVSVCLSELSFYLAMWTVGMELKKQGL